MRPKKRCEWNAEVSEINASLSVAMTYMMLPEYQRVLYSDDS